MSAAAVIALRRKKLVRCFREKNASCPERAIPFTDVGMRRSWVFDQMVDRGVFVSVGGDRFYLNEQAAQAFLIAQRRRARTIGAILLVVFLMFLLASCLW